MSKSLYLMNEEATLSLGKTLANLISGGCVIFLEGTLGAGKTCLCRSLIRALGHEGAVKSPTYTLVEPYVLLDQTLRLFHFDLYRLGDPEELEYMGIRDYFDESAVCLVEWPSKGETVLPTPDLVVHLTKNIDAKPEGRQAVISSHSGRGESLLQQLSFE